MRSTPPVMLPRVGSKGGVPSGMAQRKGDPFDPIRFPGGQGFSVGHRLGSVVKEGEGTSSNPIGPRSRPRNPIGWAPNTTGMSPTYPIVRGERQKEATNHALVTLRGTTRSIQDARVAVVTSSLDRNTPPYTVGYHPGTTCRGSAPPFESSPAKTSERKITTKNTPSIHV